MKNIDAVAAAFANRSSGFDGEILMRFVQLHKHRGRRLRFVFEDRVVAFGVADDVSFGEVARALRERFPRGMANRSASIVSNREGLSFDLAARGQLPQARSLTG